MIRIIFLLFIFMLHANLFATESKVDKFYNYPNPFKRGIENTNIVFQLKSPAQGTIKIYDVSGTLVWETSVKVTEGSEGQKNVIKWDGRTKTGHLVATGVYLCRLQILASNKSLEVYETRSIKIGVKR